MLQKKETATRGAIRYLRLAATVISLSLAIAVLAPFAADTAAYVFDTSAISAKSAILIDADSLSVLASKNERARMGEASTTKIMTALAALRVLSPDSEVKIPREAVGIEGSSVYLCEGEILSVRDLLRALLLQSANDAAAALAIAASGSIEAFAELMNSTARELGAYDTNFINPHGLYDESHYTTAYDLALISAASLKVPLLREIFSQRKAEIPRGVTELSPEGDGVRYLQNHNKMLSLYEGAIGIKTGFTKATGRCLVSAAERDGLRLIAVTLCAPDDWNDHALLLDHGFANYERVTLCDAGEFCFQYAVSGGKEGSVMATNSEPIALTLPKNMPLPGLEALFPQRFEIAPIELGETLGELCVSAFGQTVTSPLVAAYGIEAAEAKKKFKFFFWK